LPTLQASQSIVVLFYYLWWRRLKTQYGFDISYRTQIGEGLYIGHSGGIVIHGDTQIGDYCNLSQGITIGVSIRGKQAGIPKIGNRVFIGPVLLFWAVSTSETMS
jgi:serine O-acetyltransferase